MNRMLALVLMVCVAAMVGGCSTPGGGAGEETLTDPQIASDVMTRLNDDTVMGRSKPINVEVQDGVVTLRGVLRTDTLRARAESVARGTPGVKDVVNLIEER